MNRQLQKLALLNRLAQRITVALIAGAALSLSACGWGAASKTYENRNSPGDEPLVIEPKLEPPKVDTNPCKVTSFTIFFVDEASRNTKEISCDTGQILNLARSDLSEVEYRNARIDNVPIKQWYILVDPAKGFKKPNTINNEELMGLSRVYNLKYHQRQESTGLLVYLFDSKTTTP